MRCSPGNAAPLGAVSATPANNIFINGGTLRANVVPSATAAGTFTLNANRGIALGPTDNGGGTGTIDVTATTGLTYGGTMVNAGSGGGTLVKSDTGTLTLAGNSSYSGGTTVSGGTLAIGLSNNPAGSGLITLAGGNLQLYGQTSGSPATGLTTAFYAGRSSLTTGSGNDPNIATLQRLIRALRPAHAGCQIALDVRRHDHTQLAERFGRQLVLATGLHSHNELRGRHRRDVGNRSGRQLYFPDRQRRR